MFLFLVWVLGESEIYCESTVSFSSEKYSCFFTVYSNLREVLSYTAKLQFPSHSAWVKSIPVSSPYTQNVILFPSSAYMFCVLKSGVVPPIPSIVSFKTPPKRRRCYFGAGSFLSKNLLVRNFCINLWDSIYMQS